MTSRSNLEGLKKAFKQYIRSLTENQKGGIPKEFQAQLLVCLDGTTDSIGGWYLEKSSIPWTLTRWYKVSEFLRIAAQVEVTESAKQWRFSEPKLISAKTRTKQ